MTADRVVKFTGRRSLGKPRKCFNGNILEAYWKIGRLCRYKKKKKKKKNRKKEILKISSQMNSKKVKNANWLFHFQVCFHNLFPNESRNIFFERSGVSKCSDFVEFHKSLIIL